MGRQTKTSVEDLELLSAIDIMFHATQHDDETVGITTVILLLLTMHMLYDVKYDTIF